MKTPLTHTLCRPSLAGLALVLLASTSWGALTLGLISDFEDGSTQDWGANFNLDVTNVADGGPDGAGDNYLELGNQGGPNRMAMRNSALATGIDAGVERIQVYMRRPSANANGESATIRLVLWDGANRWTSTDGEIIPADDGWSLYDFSIAEADLTQVSGTGSYTDLRTNFQRIVFRHDPDTPSFGGSSLVGNVHFDDIAALGAIPEPSSVLLLTLSAALFFVRRKRVCFQK